VIGVDTVSGLSPFMSFAQGELVRGLAFSPDGTTLAAAVGDEAGYVRLYEVASGLPLRTLEGHGSIVWGLAFSPDGRLLASASRDRTAKVWDWRSGSLLQSLDFPDEVTSVAFSPDSQTLAVGGVDEWPNAAIWTYSVSSWQPGMKLAEFWNIPAIAYSPDGDLLVGGGTSRNVRVWRTSDGTEMFILYHAGQVSSLAISPDGSTAAMGLCEVSDAQTSQCTLGAVWVWDLPTGRLIRKLPDFYARVEAVTFSRDGSLILAGSQDGTMRAYASSDFRPLLVTASPEGSSPVGVLSLDLSPDGRIVATGGVGNIYLWRVEP
jgi:WD40 repeat protein